MQTKIIFAAILPNHYNVIPEPEHYEGVLEGDKSCTLA